MDFELFFKNKIGLVLSGGGAKGAYQIGVFQALRELEINKLVRTVSGTSIGALNGALFILNDPKIWEKTWKDANFSNFLYKEDDAEKESIKSFSDLTRVLKKSVKKLEKDWDSSDGISDFLLKQNLSFFSQKGLSEVIDNNINIKKIAKSKVSLHACAYNIDLLEPEYFSVDDVDKDTFKKALLASSCIPFMYDAVPIGDYHYMDGGIKNPLYKKENIDKIPVKPVYDEECDIIIVVYLKHDDDIDHSIYNNNRKNKTKIVEIYPSMPLEDIKGTGSFDFSRSSQEDRIELGYHDAMFVIAPMIVKWLRGKSVDKLIKKHDEYNKKIRAKYL
ncbi:MAG: patatin-like phospholipase family protein [bacterium]|nr:patatin-like phospholipase family protein [bacterium]